MHNFKIEKENESKSGYLTTCELGDLQYLHQEGISMYQFSTWLGLWQVVMGHDRKAYLALMIMSPSALDVLVRPLVINGYQQILTGPASCKVHPCLCQCTGVHWGRGSTMDQCIMWHRSYVFICVISIIIYVCFFAWNLWRASNVLTI